ncbi:MAG: hypothetical protein ACLFNA_05780 [Halochromatium sp.]
MRLVLIALAALWTVGALIAFLRTRRKPLDAKLSATYLVVWPALLVLMYINQPVALWFAVPVFFGFIPWFLAGPHLWSILQDPDRIKPGEVAGIPIGYWKWGGLAAVLLGLVSDFFLRP